MTRNKVRLIVGLIFAIFTIVTYATRHSSGPAGASGIFPTPDEPTQTPPLPKKPQPRTTPTTDTPDSPTKPSLPPLDTPAARGDVAVPIFPNEPTVRIADLPREARDTLERIESQGPFPFERDGITFKNREGLLMDKPDGYWSEYTVITPGERSRGARRIVAGSKGERYYSDDHYQSFRRIVP